MDEPTVTPAERRVDPTAADVTTMVGLGLADEEPEPPGHQPLPAPTTFQ